MELESESSITCPLGLSLTKTTESSSIVQSPPAFDHHQSSDSINDQFTSLSIDESEIDDGGNNGIEIGDRVEEINKVSDDKNNGVEIGGCVEEIKSVSNDENNGVEIGDCVEEVKKVSDDANNGVETANRAEEIKSVSVVYNNGVDIGDWAEEVKGVSDDDNNGVDVGDWTEGVKNDSEIAEEKEGIEDEINNEETEKEFNRRRIRYPVRSDAEDCSFYLRTGACKFGMNCKFNHPPNHKKFQGVKVKTKEEFVDSPSQKLKEKDESVDREQIDCKYFDRPGGCKFGKACKFNHSRKPNPGVKLNFMGLPIRLGEKECPFYMRNGSCKYGATCRFNHPDPTTIGVPDTLPRYSNGGSIFSPNVSQSTLAPWTPPTGLNENPPYVPLMFSPNQAVPPQPDWNPYQAPVYQPERSIQAPPPYSLKSQLLDRPEKKMQGDEFPERPGQPECNYFVKTGDCKYKSACKFHHPKSGMAQSSSCLLSDLRLPLRPGVNVCSYYSRYGICKYGPACKYDHPMNHAHSPDLTVSTVDQTPVYADI
ncbi:Zinc finger CCCH domain-containing protein 43 [Bienertia sinuspersici]